MDHNPGNDTAICLTASCVALVENVEDLNKYRPSLVRSCVILGGSTCEILKREGTQCHL